MDRYEPVRAAVAGTGVTTVGRDRPLAWLLPGLYGVLTVVGLVLQALAGRPPDPTIGLAGEVAQSAVTGVASLAGGLLAARRPANPIGWLLCGITLGWALQEFSFGYAAYGLLAHPGSLPAAATMAVLHVTMTPLILLGAALLFLLFPDGRLPSRRWRPVLWAGLVATVVLLPGAITGPIGNLGVRSPVQVDPALQRILWPVAGVAFLLLLVVLVAAVVSSWVRLRRARGQTRQQLKWFAYATALLPLGYAVAILGVDRNALTTQIGLALVVASSVAIPLAVAVAVLKYRLYEIDRIINRTLVYGALTILLGGVYAGIVLAVGQLLGGLGATTPSWAVAGATLAVAALFQPARHRIQQAVDRRFNRRRHDAAATIAAFGTRLRDQIDLDTLAAELLAVVNQTMQPTQASLWLRPPKAPAHQRAATSQHAQGPSQSKTVA